MNIPNMTIRGETTWQYPYDYIPVYSENQTIKGTFVGPSDMNGSKIAVSISGFDVPALLNAYEGKSGANIGTNALRLALNRSGDASFELNGKSSGMYTIFVMNETNSTILSALPLLVTTAVMSIDAPAKIAAGDVLNLKTNISQEGNFSRIFAAVMISHKYLDNASLGLNSMNLNNGTMNSLNTTLSLGNKSMTVQGLPKISSELLLQLINLLPIDSAVGMQETKANVAEIILITDPTWEKGSYVLISGVYAPGKGLQGLTEKMIEVA
jgi:methanogen extracellular protein (TIGR04279 family)